jgi:hypothetical protein
MGQAETKQALPEKWFEHHDADATPYYFHELTKFSSYQRPRPLPHGWRLEQDKASGSLYYWNYWTRDTFPYTKPARRVGVRVGVRFQVVSAGRVSISMRAEKVAESEPDPDAPLRRALFLSQPAPLGQLAPSAPATSRAELEAGGSVAFIGWACTVAAGETHQEPRFFLLTCGPQTQPRLAWFAGTEAQLVLQDSLDLRHIALTRRSAPDSADDFSFVVATRDASLAINPGTRDAHHRWEEGLLQCVAYRCTLPPKPARAATTAAVVAAT